MKEQDIKYKCYQCSGKGYNEGPESVYPFTYPSKIVNMCHKCEGKGIIKEIEYNNFNKNANSNIRKS